MKFSCALGTSSESIRLVNVVSYIVKAGYELVSQRQEPSKKGGNIIYIVANSKPSHTQDMVIEKLSKIDGCKLLKIKFAEAQKGASKSTMRFSANDEKSVLASLGEHYPNVVPIVKAYAAVLDESNRNEKLRALGQKVGDGIYQRDYALGSPLQISKSLTRELRPALKEFCEVEIDYSSITVFNCPFCGDKEAEVSCCEFVTGYVTGFLNSNPAISNCEVSESRCGADSNNCCTFSISA